MKKIIIGSRASILAIKQSEIVKKLLEEKFNDLEIEIKKIKTSGDINLNISLQDNSLKNMFVKEIEYELIEGKIDFAVHSMKDMPMIMPEGLALGAIPKRADSRDALIIKNNLKFKDLKEKSIVGTSSIRRKVLIKNLRSDIEIKEIRGNIHTRIGKMEAGEYDVLILAAAGLERAGLKDKITEYLNPEIFVPAPAQGALCVQCRENDKFILNLLKKINDDKSSMEVYAEREFSKVFDGGCKIPIGASAEISNNKINLRGLYFGEEKLINKSIELDISEYKNIGKILAEEIKNLIKKGR